MASAAIWIVAGGLMEPRDIVQNALDAYNARDLDLLMSYFDPGYTLNTFGKVSQHIPNRDVARAVFAAEFEETADRRTEINRLLQSGNSVVVQCRDILTHPRLGEMNVPTLMIFDVVDERIVHCDYYQDSAFWVPAS